MPTPDLQIRTNNAGQVQPIESGWRLSLPAGDGNSYRLAQLDDYGALARGDFPQRAPLTLKLQARASAATSPGTWGFGFWNEPLSASLGFGSGRRLPALPQAAWFFFAHPKNHLSFQDNRPGNGYLTASFRSRSIPTLLLAPGALALPLLVWRAGSRLLRRAASGLIAQDSASLDLDPTEWHEYALDWRASDVAFHVDGRNVFNTGLTPRAPLGLVIWLDNQYAAWAPDGRIGYGTLPNPAGWIEIRDLSITH